MKDEIKVKVLQERLEELKVKWAETETECEYDMEKIEKLEEIRRRLFKGVITPFRS